MYVAITRAKRTCVVSYATERFLYGKKEASHPSRFVAELDPEFCDKPETPRSGQGGGFGGFRYGGRSFEPAGSFNRRPVGGYQPAAGRESSFSRSSPLPSNFKRIGVRPAGPDAEPEKMLQRTPDGAYSVGSRVLHDRFGAGSVVAIICSDRNDVKLRIIFDNNKEEKTLLLKFARIKPL